MTPVKDSILYVSKITINHLDEYSLIHIFNYLPPEDKLTAEKVCKTWKDISQKSWIGVKKLKLVGNEMMINNCKEKLSNFYSIMRSLEYCKFHVRHLDLHTYDEKSNKLAEKIVIHCKALKSVKLYGVSRQVIYNLAKKNKNLEEVYLRDVIDPCDLALSKLFRRNQKIRSVDLIFVRSNNFGKYVCDLPIETLESFGAVMSNISTEYFTWIFNKAKKLSKLAFDDFRIDQKCINAIRSIQSLTDLQLGVFLPFVCNLNLRNLRKIDLSLCRIVTDNILSNLSCYCVHLSDVNISNCKQVTNEGIHSIATLPKLERLLIGELLINDNAFQAMPKLRELDCYGCKNLSNKFFVNIVKSCNSLALLNISLCQKVNIKMSTMSTNEFFDKSQQKNSPSCTTISHLNDYCLIHICQYLSIVDRIRLERVCKRWQYISKNSWYNFKELTFNKFLDLNWGFKKPDKIQNLRIRSLKRILSRCGRYIEIIKFQTPQYKFGHNLLSTIGKFCPNIEKIYVPEMKFTPESIAALAARCSKINVLSLGDSTNDCDNELALLFHRNKNLKELSFHFNYSITGECLLALNPESIEVIIFTNCLSIVLNYFSIVRIFKNLKVLSIEHFHDSNDRIIQDISKCFKSLQYLQLSLCPDFSNSLSKIGKLSNLKSLDVASLNSVDDDFLKIISQNCKLLQIIDISYCQSVSNRGVTNIITLPNLTHLAIEKLRNVNDEVFNCSFLNLKCVDASFNSEMRDDGISRLIQYSEKIEHLYLNGCSNISNKLIENAIKFTKKRKNKVVLYMHLSNTNIKLHKISDQSPFLKIIPLIVVDDCSELCF